MAELSVELYRLDGPTIVRVDAEIRADGALVVSGQDLGEAPRAAFDEEDYEYWLTVESAHKDRLLLLLLQRLYGGRPMVVSELRAWLDEVGVPWGFETF